ncbi:universal stress protein [Mycolicibacterium litorale]|uniref:Universal stress protein n=1 Tax=Candidatus Mycolicibacterium alkanivorans TaxID=2954114 RepID=A0ABS9YSK6_9MYCO|nr:universal stress protein [Candidatus Mycolicibacterium alkanivorans]MCI4674132.1 universal stress protein [Candidatus Mycolicibacterium alkanivorans]
MSDRSTQPAVVVGVDGSPSSIMAVRWAAREATMRNAGLTVVHGLSPLAVWPAVPIPAELHRLPRAGRGTAGPARLGQHRRGACSPRPGDRRPPLMRCPAPSLEVN